MKKNEDLEFTIYHRNYFVSWLGKKFWFGGAWAGNDLLVLDFQLNTHAGLKQAEDIIARKNDLRSCSIMQFKELEVY